MSRSTRGREQIVAPVAATFAATPFDVVQCLAFDVVFRVDSGATATFTITDTCDHAGFVNALPMIHNRWMPAIESDGSDSLDELVTMRGYDGEVGRSFTGDFDISVFDSPVEELGRLQPRELIACYWREVAVSWKGGTTLERVVPPAIEPG